jgi:hypothetical protein
MASFLPHSRLTALQRELLVAFFEREQRLFLTGGAALAGFYLGHRATEDLDLFTPPGPSLDEAARALADAAEPCGAEVRPGRLFEEFKRFHVLRGGETCIVDLVVDRAPMIEPEKTSFGSIRVDTLREIAANKVCTVLSRSEIKDMVDLFALVRQGIGVDGAVADALRKDAGAEPATLAWVLDQLSIGPQARLPGGVEPSEVLVFRDELVRKLRAMAFEQANGSRTPIGRRP